MTGTINGSAINTRIVNDAPVPGTESADVVVSFDFAGTARRRIQAMAAGTVELGTATSPTRRVHIHAAIDVEAKASAYPISGEDLRNLFEGHVEVEAVLVAALRFRTMAAAPAFRTTAVSRQHTRYDAEALT